MSLISDALKEAQRERRGRGGEQNVVPLYESVFPSARRTKKGWKPTAMVVGALVMAGIAVGSTAVILKHLPSATRSNATPAQTRANNSAPTTPAGASRAPVAGGARSNTPPATSSTTIAPRETTTGRTKTPPSTVASSATTTDRVEQRSGPVVPTGAARPSAPTVATVSPPAPERPAPRGVRVVLDPVGSSPADSLSRLAYAEHTKGSLDVARDLYEKAIATKQAPAEVFNNYGVLLLQQSNRALATEMFRQAISRDDTNVEAWINLGDAYIAAGHHASALSAFDRARQLDPARASIKIRLAGEYLEIGDTASARRLYQDAVQSKPSDPRAHYALATFLLVVNDTAAAMREFDAFLTIAAASRGEFTAEKLEEVKRYVDSLRRRSP